MLYSLKLLPFCEGVCDIVEEYMKKHISEENLIHTLKIGLGYPINAFTYFSNKKLLEWISKLKMLHYIFIYCDGCKTSLLVWDDIEKIICCKQCDVNCEKYICSIYLIRTNPFYNKMIFNVKLETS